MKSLLALIFHGLVFLAASGLCRADDLGSSERIHVYAAGSLSGALKAIVTRYEAETGQKIDLVTGPSGLLLEKIEQGGDADLFLSANMPHPAQLAREGKGLPPVIFIRNSMCILARPSLGLASHNLLDKLLDPAIRIGTSTPHADPGGDYAWELFAKAETVHPGAQKILEAKAQKLVGGEILPQPGRQPASRQSSPVKQFLSDGTVDTFIGYCSRREATPDPDFDSVRPPENLTIAVDYGLTSIVARPSDRQLASLRFALYLLTPEIQKLFADYGFMPVTSNSRH